MRHARLRVLVARRMFCSSTLPPSSTPTTIREVLHPHASGRAGWVSDSAGVLPPATVARLNEKLDALKRTTSHEMAIVCLEDLDGQARKLGGGPPQSYGLFTEWLFDEWGVGRREHNDGVMLVLYRRGRRVEIRTGKGLKYQLPESFLQSVVDQRMIPAFKEGRHANGVEVGAGAILRRLMPTSNPDPWAAPVGALPGFGGGNRKGGGGGALTSGGGGGGGGGGDGDDNTLFWLGVMVVSGALPLLVAWEWRADRKRRACPGCSAVMARTKTDLENHLAPLPARFDASRCGTGQGQTPCHPDCLGACARDERASGSCTFTLLRCPKCGGERVLREEHSGFSRCNHCACRTLKEENHVVTHATTWSTGTRAHAEDCRHCGHTARWTTTIPRQSNSGSSGGGGGGGGGGGFGGGSSSGGGSAGGSWLAEEERPSFWDTKPSEHIAGGVRRARRALGGEDAE